MNREFGYNKKEIIAKKIDLRRRSIREVQLDERRDEMRRKMEERSMRAKHKAEEKIVHIQKKAQRRQIERRTVIKERTDTQKRRRKPQQRKPQLWVKMLIVVIKAIQTSTRFIKNFRAKKLVAIVALAVVVVGFIFTSVAPHTLVKIEPVVSTISFDDSVFSAFYTNNISNVDISKKDKLYYSLIEWQTENSKFLDSDSKEYIEEKAVGTITVYNRYSNSVQRLIANTRFKTNDGLIYRIKKSISIPGMAGGNPGSVSIKVYADKPGEKYNKQAATLKVPGLLRNKKMYNGIYAEITKQITGGFKGEKLVIDKEIKQNALNILKKEILSGIVMELQNKIPENGLYFKDGVKIDFEEFTENTDDGKIKLIAQANITAMVFNAINFANQISIGAKDTSQAEYVTVQNKDTLDVVINKKDLQALDRGNIRVVINGVANILSHTDTDILKEQLIGENHTKLESILSRYPAINAAKVVHRPFWKNVFPDNPDDIDIEIIE